MNGWMGILRRYERKRDEEGGRGERGDALASIACMRVFPSIRFDSGRGRIRLFFFFLWLGIEVGCCGEVR